VSQGLVVVVDDATRDTAELEEYAASHNLARPEITSYEPTFDELFVMIVEAHANPSGAAA